MAFALLLTGCASKVPPPAPATAEPPELTGGGRYAISADAYPLDPPDVSQVPNAEPRVEPLSRAGNRPTYEVWGETYRVLPDARGYVKEGMASWYGEKFHGYATSNGEIYDMYKMSAAHRSLPLPTFARVTSLENGSSVIVRINDRGPFHSEREIDLSYAAAYQLGFTEAGTGRVRVEAIDPQGWAGHSSINTAQLPASDTTDRRTNSSGYLQVAALSDRGSATQLKRQLQSRLDQNVRIADDGGVYRVQVGPVGHQREELALRETLRQAGYPQAFIVK
ncbi:septal ring lytic transglycosylase RlpA family protein [Halomonas sp. TBZ9]|uniref:Endolytic peptidoglycan transglycosylase RlpA n=2 Tax=Vreelandella azerica TaxID=2732867 RepID=A0A7Y3TZB7_9GAMM|nr:septal ring lytic transglycosylase RlpA family protein [Halomonas azerica]